MGCLKWGTGQATGPGAANSDTGCMESSTSLALMYMFDFFFFKSKVNINKKHYLQAQLFLSKGLGAQPSFCQQRAPAQTQHLPPSLRHSRPTGASATPKGLSPAYLQLVD